MTRRLLDCFLPAARCDLADYWKHANRLSTKLGRRGAAQ
ncbi:hypothetical protein SPHINGO391_470073 [Sphingomonas aurantiaca]|uniref:Uncharacterized protein n=1 Tax=Sphingomonas aurantiaca TaxID=185949 RepID=A0A5E7ZV69_9SPHN|nr:hypothetical protein SPHINGO391_470073 [Sphingomonas aurantiaca]